MRNQAAAEKISVIIVDDEPCIGDALKLVLEAQRYDVVVADNGHAALNQAGKTRFRVGIFDLNLPDMSGLEVIRTIRARQPELLTILMTGQGSPQAFSEARRLGVAGILSKPFRPADVLQLLSTLLV